MIRSAECRSWKEESWGQETEVRPATKESILTRGEILPRSVGAHVPDSGSNVFAATLRSTAPSRMLVQVPSLPRGKLLSQ